MISKGCWRAIGSHCSTVLKRFSGGHRHLSVISLMVVGLAALVSVGCTAPEPPLRVASILWVGYQPLHLAQSLGYFPKHSVRLADFNSNTESLRAFRNGDVEVAALTLDEVLLLRAEGHDARVVLIMDYSQGADAIVGRPEIADLAGLKGRRIGVESTAAGAYLLARALEFAGLTTNDVDIVKMGAETQEQAYQTGRADAFATYEPIRTRLIRLGAKELFNSTQMPGEIVDVLAVRGTTLDTHRDAIAAILDGWFKATAYADTMPMDAAQRLAPRLSLTPEEYLQAVHGMRFPSLQENCELLAAPASPMHATVKRLHTLMIQMGLLATQNPPDRLLESGILRQLGCPSLTSHNQSRKTTG